MMGLFDILEQAAGVNGGTTQGAGPASSVVGAVIEMVQAQPGGLPGVIQRFEAAGLGGVAQSWISSGANQSVTPGQAQAALGQGAVGQVAGRLGVSADQAAGHIAQVLPMILDHLSPAGQMPLGGAMGEIEALLSRANTR